MSYELPEFEKREMYKVLPYATSVFAKSLVKLVEYDDGHFRAIFKKSYFVLQGDNTEPSNSQWSTLKKRMKRRNKGVFVFKETGTTPCNPEADPAETDDDKLCYYVDFGFFLH